MYAYHGRISFHKMRVNNFVELNRLLTSIDINKINAILFTNKLWITFLL